ncbi:MAG: protein kinase [Candidatus Schekmanbacteria bacterium]|nr:protein kinase [Candidatus Schekmanbacteria bacterium]
MEDRQQTGLSGRPTTADVKAFLTRLAMVQRVSASTQNQAFSALLLLFREVLRTDLAEQVSRSIDSSRARNYAAAMLQRRIASLLLPAMVSLVLAGQPSVAPVCADGKPAQSEDLAPLARLQSWAPTVSERLTRAVREAEGADLQARAAHLQQVLESTTLSAGERAAGLWTLARWHRRLGELEAAVLAYRAAFAAISAASGSREVPARNDFALALLTETIGVLHSELGRVDDSITLIPEAMLLAPRSGSETWQERLRAWLHQSHELFARERVTRLRERFRFSTFTTTDGLCDPNIMRLMLDRAAGLWIGSSQGLCRFDGVAFTPVPVGAQGDRATVWALAEDASGRIWVGLSSGLRVVDRGRVVRAPGTEALASAAVRALAVAPDGAVWIGSKGGIVQVYRDGNLQTLAAAGHGEIEAIHAQADGVVWLVAAEGLGRWSADSPLEWWSPPACPALPGATATDNKLAAATSGPEESGELWLGTSCGVWRFRAGAWTRPLWAEQLPEGASLSALTVDRAGNLWIGYEAAGLFMVEGTRVTPLGEAEGLGRNNVQSVVDDGRGRLWIGTFGGGLSRYEPSRARIFRRTSGLPHDVTYAVRLDRSGQLWVGTWGGGVARFDGRAFRYYGQEQGLADNLVCRILEDHLGNIWFGTFAGGASRFDGRRWEHIDSKRGITDNFVAAIHEDRSGRFWFGTWRGGVCRLDEPAGKVACFQQEAGLLAEQVLGIAEAEDRRLFFATDHGIFTLEPTPGARFTRLGHDDGVPAESFLGLLVDTGGAGGQADDVWMGSTSNRLYRYRRTARSGERLASWGKSEGMRAHEITEIQRGPRDLLWVASDAGVGIFDGETWSWLDEEDGLAHRQTWSLAFARAREQARPAADVAWIATSGGLTRIELPPDTPKTRIALAPAGEESLTPVTISDAEITLAVEARTPWVHPRRDSFWFSARVDSGPWGAWQAEPNLALPLLARGLHTVEVRAKNRYLAVDASPARIVVDVQPARPYWPWLAVVAVALALARQYRETLRFALERALVAVLRGRRFAPVPEGRFWTRALPAGDAPILIRGDVTETLHRELARSATEGASLLLYGELGCGKSTLLRLLAAGRLHPPGMMVQPLCVDLSADPTAAAILQEVLERLSGALEEAPPEPGAAATADAESSSADSSALQRLFMARFQELRGRLPAPGGSRAVILLDAAERSTALMGPLPGKRSIGDIAPFVACLRALLAAGVSLVFAFDRHRDALRADFAELYSISTPVRVGFVAEPEATDFLLRATHRHLVWEAKAMRLAVQLSGGHAGLLQELGQRIARAHNRLATPLVRYRQLQSIADDLAEAPPPRLEELGASLANRERVLVSLIAAALRRASPAAAWEPTAAIPLRDVQAEAEKHHVPLLYEEIRKVTLSLTQRGLLFAGAGGESVGVRVGLLLKWMQTACPPERTIHEQNRYIGKYELMGVLGKGGMGTVYRARDLTTLSEVALKVMPPEFGDDPTRRARFIREGRIGVNLSHRNIVGIRERGEHDGTYYLAMELLDGVTLEALAGWYARERRRPGTELLAIVGCEVARALAAIHGRGVIHRDVKGENVMVTSLGEVKLMDFGLAIASDLGKVTTSGVAVGTIATMSPEQARGEEVDGRSDLYSLGVVLFQLATGQHPLGDESGMKLLLAVLRAPARPLGELREDLPQAFTAVIDRMLSKDREQRPASAAAVLQELTAFSPQSPEGPRRELVEATAAIVALSARQDG